MQASQHVVELLNVDSVSDEAIPNEVKNLSKSNRSGNLSINNSTLQLKSLNTSTRVGEQSNVVTNDDNVIDEAEAGLASTSQQVTNKDLAIETNAQLTKMKSSENVPMSLSFKRTATNDDVSRSEECDTSIMDADDNDVSIYKQGNKTIEGKRLKANFSVKEKSVNKSSKAL